MKKYILDLIVTENIPLNENYVLLKLTLDTPLPDMVPGQFAELKVEGSQTTFLRRPISIHYFDKVKNEVWFLIQLIGDGTRQLAKSDVNSKINTMIPLGRGFTLCSKKSKPLLIGGGVGIAPLLFLGKQLFENGIKPTFLLGGRTRKDLLQLDEFSLYGEIYTTTEDESHGEKGFVTHHSILQSSLQFDNIYTCGPKAMMAVVAKYATEKKIGCEVSLENTMACGIGACLCCVENTTNGHVCVCKEGPVFNISELLWQI